MSGRQDNISGMRVSEATRKLNPGLFAGPIVNIKPRKLGQKMCDDIARDVLAKITPPPEPAGPRYRSKWEREYHEILLSRFTTVEHEPLRLKIGRKAYYKPDFLVVGGFDPDLRGPVNMIFYEVKGHWREAARVRIKVAASKYPWARFVAVVKQKKKDGGGWKEEVFQP